MSSTCPFHASATSPPPASPDIKSPLFDIPGPEAKTEMKKQLDRLSQEQKEIFKKTFPAIFAESKRNGLVLFARYLSDHPHYKKIWPQFRNLQDSALIASNELANHCSVYMCGLKEIIEVMDDDERLTFFMARIARSHVKWNINKYHITNMIAGVEDVLKRCFGNDVDPKIIEAYTTFYDVIGNMLDIQKKLVVKKPMG